MERGVGVNQTCALTRMNTGKYKDYKEVREREKRSKKLILFNLPESAAEAPETRIEKHSCPCVMMN